MSKQRAWIVTLCGVLMIALGAPANAQETRTPRDAYVEAWFQETAEADLEGALKLYKECADKAATSDRELAAKALLRMAKIASARGDSDAAKLLAERIATEFSGTSAAKDGVALEGSAGSAKVSTETREVDEARKWLDEMLTNENDNSQRKADTVLRTLGMEEVLRVYAARGGRLANVFLHPSPDVLEESEWVALALRTDLGENYPYVPNLAINRLKVRRPGKVPDALAAGLDLRDAQIASAFADLCLSIGTKESLELLERAIPQCRDGVFLITFFRKLSASDALEIGGVMDVWFAEVDSRSEDLRSNIYANLTMNNSVHNLSIGSLVGSKPFAVAMRRHFPNLSPRVRRDLAYRDLVSKLPSADPEPITDWLVDLLLADPEPLVRHAVIANQLASTRPDARLRAVTAIVAEPRPLEVQTLSAGVSRISVDAVPTVLGETSGALRGFYYGVFLRRSDTALDAIRHGLDRNDAELLYALFDSRVGTTGELLSNGQPLAALAAFDNGDTEPTLIRLLEADADPDLLRKVVGAVIASKDERLAIATLFALRNNTKSRITNGVAQLFAAKGSPRVDFALVSSREWWAQLDKESMRRLTRHPLREVRVLAIQRLADPELLVEAIAEADVDDLASLLAQSRILASTRALLAVLQRAESSSRVALDTFVELLPIADEALILACERGGAEDDLGIAAAAVVEPLIDGDMEAAIRTEPGQSFAEARAERDAAREKAKADGNPIALVYRKLRGIELPSALREELADARQSAGGDGLQFLRGAAKTLREHRAEWAAAFVSWRAKLVVAQVPLEQQQVDGRVGYFGAQLAALGARDFSADLLDSANGYYRVVGLHALARLGDKERVVAYANVHVDPREWLEPALLVGADTEIRGWVEAGRVSALEVFAIDSVCVEPQHNDLALALALDDGAVPQRDGFNWSGEVKLLVDRLAAANDVERLSRAVRFYDSVDAVAALFQIGAIERILTEFPDWPNSAAERVFTEMRQRTDSPPANSNFDRSLRTVRLELVAIWREKLRK